MTNLTNSEILTIPRGAGRAIVHAAALIACPLQGTDRFAKSCTDRNLSVDRERLLRLERLGLFSPLFRIHIPDKEAAPLLIPSEMTAEWFKRGWAWDTASAEPHRMPEHEDGTQEGYYSIFQVDHLSIVLSSMTLSLQMDSFADPTCPTIDWQARGEGWLQHSLHDIQSLRIHEYRRSIALLCQLISNRYYPQTQSDERTIQVSNGFYQDAWISIHAQKWDWYEQVRRWRPQETASFFQLTPRKLRHAFETLSTAQDTCDPLSDWYQLVRFVSLRERSRLKGDALRAETLRSGAQMLRFLYSDLYGEELPHPNEIGRTIITHMPELEVRRDKRRFLEFVVNRFGLNPQPRAAILVEGASEKRALEMVFEGHLGLHPGTLGIEIIDLKGVNTATGGKQDRFRAILRLVDYLHHHQTFAFLILDNENSAKQLKAAAKKAKSIHHNRRHVTRPEYVAVWRRSFEFDNFSCTELAAAMDQLAAGRAQFTWSEVAVCRNDINPGVRLMKLYHQKTNFDLPKVKLTEMLVERMLSSGRRRKPDNRPIVKLLRRIQGLAARNHLPTTEEIWKSNQASKYLGKKGR
jgi:hypothetical protein